jgi:hypothetical protein
MTGVQTAANHHGREEPDNYAIDGDIGSIDRFFFDDGR